MTDHLPYEASTPELLAEGGTSTVTAVDAFVSLTAKELVKLVRDAKDDSGRVVDMSKVNWLKGVSEGGVYAHWRAMIPGSTYLDRTDLLSQWRMVNGIDTPKSTEVGGGGGSGGGWYI